MPPGGSIQLELPPGHYTIATYGPVTGQYSPVMPVEGGKPVVVELLPFVHDVAIVVRRAGAHRSVGE